ncbi:MAG: fibronectin type III domain-containing protein [Candidatus Shapirobacteria bacterium]
MNRKCFGLFLIGCLIGINLLRFGLLIKPKQVMATDYYVDPSGTNDGSHGTASGANAFQTIQYAIGDTRVVDGDTLNIATGEYVEQVNITKAIVLNGTGGTTVIKPNSLDVYVTTPSGMTTGIIVVNDIGSTVTVENLTVDASSLSTDRVDWFGSTIPDMRFGGVFFYNTSGVIENVSSIHNDHVVIPIGSESWKSGIHAFWADADTTSAKAVEISGCTASNFLSSGIQIGETTTNITVNIHNNVINGGGILTTRRQGGIKVYDGATVTAISGNVVSDLHYNTADWDTAIEVINIQDGAVIENNTIINCDFGITDRYSSEVNIQNNDISGSGHTYGTGIYLDNEQANINNSTLYLNTIGSGFPRGGISLEGFTPNSHTVGVSVLENTLTGDGTSNSSAIFDLGDGAVTTSITGNNISGWDKGIFLDVGTSIGGYEITENLIFSNTSYNLRNNTADTVSAINNWWGSKNYQVTKSLIYGNATFIPYYIENSRNYLVVNQVGGTATISSNNQYLAVITNSTTPANITINSGITSPTIDFSGFISSGSGTLPEVNILANNVNGVGISIQASTSISSTDIGWDGMMLAPTAISTTIPEVSGETRTVETAIDVGVTDVKLSFDKAVRILFPDQAGNRVGYLRSAIPFTEITTTCGSDSGATLGVDEDCKIDVGNDLVVWTRHFTKFIVFSSVSTITPTPTPTPTPTSSPSTSTSTSSISSTGWAAPACSATKPGGTPIITNTINGDNSVTLTWSKASNPVTKYLIAYGTSSGSIEYGNPNVGNADTTSYTIKGLSGGTRYYFKIKAINDCMPGDWSNEVSATPRGRIIETTTGGTTGETTTPAEGFVPVSQIPSQLFDIALIVDKTQITKASELAARVTFVSFGKEDTPVEMTFTIVDANGKEYYRSIDNTSIQTEGVFNKTFEGLLLDKGKYTLVLNTLYNTNIKDEFKQNFEVGDFTSSPTTNFLENKLLMIIIGGGIILILISWIIGLVRRRK